MHRAALFTATLAFFAQFASSTAYATTPQPGDVDFSFDPGSINDMVLEVAIQPDGKVLIGGRFTSVGGVARGRIARLNSNGSTDQTFGNGLAGANGPISSVAVQPDGRVLIGGGFTTVDGVSRIGVARLNADGSLDTTFLNGLAGATTLNGASSSLTSIAVQPDGRALIGGPFNRVNGVQRNCVARLNADGSLDTTFLNGMAGMFCDISSVAVQPDGRVLIGGAWTNSNFLYYVGRLNGNGSLDTTFHNGVAPDNSNVYSVAIQPDASMLIGGAFFRGNELLRRYVAHLSADGSPDTTFENVGLGGANSRVYSVAVQPDGRVLIGGSFATVNGVSRNHVARLNADGSLDTTFLSGLAGANDFVYSTVVQPDGRVLIGGGFTTVNGVSRNYVARLYGSSPACSGTPNEVNSVLASRSDATATFEWDAASEANAYDVLRGVVGDWPVGSTPSTETCFDDVPVTTASDATVPAEGAGYWYLVRAENACGNGGYGSQASNGVPTALRLSGTCP